MKVEKLVNLVQVESGLLIRLAPEAQVRCFLKRSEKRNEALVKEFDFIRKVLTCCRN